MLFTHTPAGLCLEDWSYDIYPTINLNLTLRVRAQGVGAQWGGVSAFVVALCGRLTVNEGCAENAVPRWGK
jgi:hypothetical protein